MIVKYLYISRKAMSLVTEFKIKIAIFVKFVELPRSWDGDLLPGRGMLSKKWRRYRENEDTKRTVCLQCILIAGQV